ncbi:heat shock 70kDa protein 4 [Nematocida sp. AWRm80]|nr:heat shock 70kDa protein 4 [Nematocida sp. AWRm80]
MNVLAIDIGGYKAVVASSDNNMVEVVLDENDRRSTQMSIDYRGKKRSFGVIGSTYKNREKVAENIREEIARLSEEYRVKGVDYKLEDASHLYSMINHLVNNYLRKTNQTLKNIELQLVVPDVYNEAQRRILIKLVEQIGIVPTVVSDSQALAAYYLSRRPPQTPRCILLVDVGDSLTRLTLTVISQGVINIVSKKILVIGGRRITDNLVESIYERYIKQIPEAFSMDEFRVRNIKQINWIKNALCGLPEIKTRMDASYEQSVEVTVRREEIEQNCHGLFVEVPQAIEELVKYAKETILNNPVTPEKETKVEELEIELVGGSSKYPGFTQAIQERTGIKPHVHFNQDESAALGGVCRKLMESPFHRFRFDPVIYDFTFSTYTIVIEDPLPKEPRHHREIKTLVDHKARKHSGTKTKSSAPESSFREIQIIKPLHKFIKDTKAKLTSISYDKTVKILKSPMKSIKLTRITPESKIILFVDSYPLYCLSLAEPDNTQKLTEETDTNETTSHENSPDAENTPKPGERTVKLIAGLDSQGFLTISSTDLTITSLMSELDFSKAKSIDSKSTQTEREIVQIEDKLNHIQSTLFKVLDTISSTPLAQMPSADKIQEYIWEFINTMPSNLSSLKEVTALEASLESSPIIDTLRIEWLSLVESISKRISKEYSRPTIQPPFPGIFSLYDPETKILSEIQRQIKEEEEQQERDRLFQEQREKARLEKEAREKEELQKEANQPEPSTEPSANSVPTDSTAA